ncbi:hypothetical protein [Actinoplanes sp. NPDC020271]|uniref:hypothetical protein n=1 Tax=Actinoplanes sp. NPDC020271 TaxID=3363896 RepID=UPI0037BD4548
MARHLPEQPAARPVVHYYPDPAMVADLERLNATQIAAKQAQDRILYARWVKRQEAIKEQDRRHARFAIGFGSVVGVGVLSVVGFVGWSLFTWLASVGAGVLAIPVLFALLVMGAIGGHRCVTVVQHWH